MEARLKACRAAVPPSRRIRDIHTSSITPPSIGNSSNPYEK